MVTCPFGRQGALRMIAAITQAEVSRTRLCHLKRMADPPPIAAARACQATFDWVVYAQPSHVVSGATCAQRLGVSPPLSVAIPFALAPLQPSHVARPEAVSPGHSYRSHFVGVLPCTRFSQPGLLGSGLYG
jgi:hypothetical protein